MKKSAFLIGLVYMAGFMIVPAINAQETIITLPAPNTTGGKPLMQALSEQKSTRVFAPAALSAEILSNLLWAAHGINRPDGKRTSPTAMNMQQIDIYLALADGLYLYDAPAHNLKLVLADDIREHVGIQPFTAQAPAGLIYVANYEKMPMNKENQAFYAATDTGFISQNVYLFCASEELATVVLGGVDRGVLTQAMNIRKDQRVILCQVVGYQI